MQPEKTTARRGLRAWITAGLGITLVAVAAAALVGNAVFSTPSVRTGAAVGVSASVDPASSATASAAPTVTATVTPTATPLPPTMADNEAPAVGAPTTPKAPTTKATGEAAFEAQVLTLVNQERAKAGCKALTSDTRLAKAAKAHSADMAARDYFDHTTPDGVSFSARITSAGYRWSAVAENIAEGQKDPTAVMKAWMNSSGHRANILNCGYRNIGVGLAYNAGKTPYWTQDFGTPA